jgi:hypothetical protein
MDCFDPESFKDLQSSFSAITRRETREGGKGEIERRWAIILFDLSLLSLFPLSPTLLVYSSLSITIVPSYFVRLNPSVAAE